MADSPFQDLFPDAPAPDPVRQIRSAAARIRQLRGQVGTEGLTPSATRSLLDELSLALDRCAGALDELRGDSPDAAGGGLPL